MTTFILIPGLVSDGRVWQALAENLASRGEVFSADITALDRIPAMAETLLRQTRGDLVVVGHSLGGRVAIEIAHQAPDRVRALVLANTGHAPKKDGEEVRRQSMVDLGHCSMQALAELWLPPMLDPMRVSDNQLMDALRRMVVQAGAETHARQIQALVHRPDASLTLPHVTCPVLLLTGVQDSWSPEAQHREMAAMVKDATLEVIDEAGHFLPIEQPEKTRDTITNWLRNRGLI